MDDTWFDRDLPVLEAVIALGDESDGSDLINAWEVRQRSGLDEAQVQAALRALIDVRYLAESSAILGGHVDAVGSPTAAARAAAGAWPSPDGLVERLIAALDAAGDDPSRTEEERSWLKRAATSIGSFGRAAAIAALGGAAGGLVG